MKLAFRPSLAYTGITLLLLSLFMTLGFWQLDRARQKLLIKSNFDQQMMLPIVDISTISNITENIYRRVTATGYYDNQHQFLLDNQIGNNKQAGYQVITPFKLLGGKTILVNRGWIPLVNGMRQELPNIKLNDNMLQRTVLFGSIVNNIKPSIILKNYTDSIINQWPIVIPYVQYDQLSALLNYHLEPICVLLERGSSSGYELLNNNIVNSINPDKHNGYAVQWFALAVTVLVYYIFNNIRRL